MKHVKTSQVRFVAEEHCSEDQGRAPRSFYEWFTCTSRVGIVPPRLLGSEFATSLINHSSTASSSTSSVKAPKEPRLVDPPETWETPSHRVRPRPATTPPVGRCASTLRKNQASPLQRTRAVCMNQLLTGSRSRFSAV